MHLRKLIYPLCLLLALTVVFYEHHTVTAVNAKESSQSPRLIVPLINANNEEMGEAVLTETPRGVRIALRAEGLKPGIHAIHFHESGVCTPPDFMTSGAHFNPEQKKHGLNSPYGPHAGDMANIFVDRHGNVDTVLFNPRVTLVKGQVNSLRDADGSALIIHEYGDDQHTDPAGNSGKRILCGVIR
ncbi:superoxide dismutase family protein [Sporolactobacillus vineae]|uniref:superoxide dismutase family protein n=1 Tax=Sporolactobacillus vineae TaxID=444463 RepID=UPI0002882CF7|nr:superoxide dismutase family protein [Sporolactobacillus vineae]